LAKEIQRKGSKAADILPSSRGTELQSQPDAALLLLFLLDPKKGKVHIEFTERLPPDFPIIATLLPQPKNSPFSESEPSMRRHTHSRLRKLLTAFEKPIVRYNLWAYLGPVKHIGNPSCDIRIGLSARSALVCVNGLDEGGIFRTIGAQIP
jgi:hypothetical protein